METFLRWVVFTMTSQLEESDPGSVSISLYQWDKLKLQVKTVVEENEMLATQVNTHTPRHTHRHRHTGKHTHTQTHTPNNSITICPLPLQRWFPFAPFYEYGYAGLCSFWLFSQIITFLAKYYFGNFHTQEAVLKRTIGELTDQFEEQNTNQLNEVANLKQSKEVMKERIKLMQDEKQKLTKGKDHGPVMLCLWLILKRW